MKTAMIGLAVGAVLATQASASPPVDPVQTKYVPAGAVRHLDRDCTIDHASALDGRTLKKLRVAARDPDGHFAAFGNGRLVLVEHAKLTNERHRPAIVVVYCR
jgi:hypothetical protein